MRIRLAVTLAALLLYSAFRLPPSVFGDWNRFRGPNGSGVDPAANTPAAFTDKDVNWRIDLPGVGHSSPVVVGKKIFLTASDPDSIKRYLLCVDLDSGKPLWRKEYTLRPVRMNKDNIGASGSPAADASQVYFTFVGQEGYKVYCLDHAGNDKWTYDLGKWDSQHGCGCSPIVVDDLLIVPNDQDGPTASIVALDKTTGKPRWQVPRKTGANGAAASTPCIYQPANGGPAQVVLTSRSEGITALDPKDGHTIWAAANVFPFRPVGSPIVVGPVVIGTCGEGAANRACVAVEPSSTPGEAPKVLYKLPTGRDYPYVPSPVVKDDLLYTWSDVGTVTCSRLVTGEKVWQEKIKAEKGRAEFYSSPIIAGDKLYNITKDGEIICLKAGDKFEKLGSSQLDDHCFATPAIVGNKLIIRTASKMISVGR
jgi:outer membrane protein assembly factor BamB